MVGDCSRSVRRPFPWLSTRGVENVSIEAPMLGLERTNMLLTTETVPSTIKFPCKVLPVVPPMMVVLDRVDGGVGEKHVHAVIFYRTMRKPRSQAATEKALRVFL